MNILIADDDITFSNKLSLDFSMYFKTKLDDISLTLKTSDFFHIKTTQIDIAFLDIDLQICNGIDYGQYLRDLYPHIIIIYISAREDLVFNTFSTGIFQFIRKSKYEQDSILVFEQLNQYLKKKTNKKTLTINGRITTIDLNKVLYIISIGPDVIITLYNKKNYTLKMSIDKILSVLNSSLLIQIQRNLVINFNYLTIVKRTNVVTRDGTNYKVGRKYQNNLIIRYENFIINDY